ncbi:MAG TPA: tetratricopeptide repeat protein [Pyrinomonadaceae bacterium]|jgi:tetratricopeptide (TPR) repeat protein
MMRRTLHSLSFALLLAASVALTAGAQRKSPAQGAKGKARPAAGKSKPAARPADADALKAELDEIVKLDAAARVERLTAFVKANPETPQTLRAQELLTSARAALGDERLRSSDRAAGIELFRAAVAEAPAAMSDRLFAEVVAQLPANLYLLGEREAGLELARAVEARAAGSAARLLAVASFYLGVELPEEAARVAQAAIALQPDSAAARQALGTAHRYALRLDEAAAEFARAFELDPKSAASRRALAELRRATGKPEEAVTLYREQLAADAGDRNARSGLVLALFEAGRREEAERELQSALQGEARDLPLLVGASYWYASRGEGAKALELAEKAVSYEPRFGWAWARVAQGRALLALKRPLEAERALRAARRFGNFPTLDYELAAALAAAGLYEEAAEQLSRSFTLKDGKLSARLAGRVEASAADFDELLAPERRASLAQFAGAAPAEEARSLKALLALRQATAVEGGDARAAAEAAREFGAGEDEMRAYRNLYAAALLEHRGAAHAEALARAEAAVAGVEPALGLAHAPVALFADTDELREMRRQVVEQDAPLSMLGVQRDTLSRVMRGRIEALAGWALYNQGQTAEAAVRLRRAVSVLPEGTVWWRTAEWRLGAALEASGRGRDALAAYVTAYRAQPDPKLAPAIEALYRKLNNGSLDGLEQLLQTPAVTAATASPTRPAPSATTATNATNSAAVATPTPATTAAAPASTSESPAPGASATPAPEPSSAAATPAAGPSPEPTPAATPTPTPEPTPTPSAEPTPTPSPTPAAPPAAETPSPDPAASPEPSRAEPREPAAPEATPTPETTPATPAATPSPEMTPSPEPAPAAAASRPAPGGPCVLTAAQTTLDLKGNGGSATVMLTLDNYAGRTPARINPSTPNWADIIILAEPRAPADGDGARFTVTSVSAKTGAFVVTFTSPCGKQQVTVNVK